MNIEEIMKPYFEKKEEFSKKYIELQNSQSEIINRYEEENKKYKEENESYEREIAAINVRLENSRKNRNAEIEEYVKNAVSDRPEFYVGYGAMIRKDLEQEYINREKALERQRNEFSDKINNNYLKIAENNKLIEKIQQTKNVGETNKFYNVDVREIVDIKHDLRKSLISAKKEIEVKIQETGLRFDSVMYKLSTFKYEYDENHNVLNGNEYRELFELSNSLIEIKYSLQRDSKQIDEYLKLTELTEEEVKIVMMSMTDLEKEEYNRRKNSVQNIKQHIPSVEVKESVDNELVEESVSLELDDEEKESEILSETSISQNEVDNNELQQSVIDNERTVIDDEEELEHNYTEFIEEISNDVFRCVKKLRTVKIQDGKATQITPGKENKEYELSSDSAEQIELVNGLYLNRYDVEKAARNYKRQSKGRTFSVKGIDLALKVTKKSVNKVKEILRGFSLQDLLSEKKISVFDVKRVYGKDKAEEYTKNEPSVEFKAEDYVKLSDVHEAFKGLFIEKTPTWLERLTSKFRKNEVEELEDIQDAEYVQVQDEMTWNAEEPEYEVVRAKSK